MGTSARFGFYEEDENKVISETSQTHDGNPFSIIEEWRELMDMDVESYRNYIQPTFDGNPFSIIEEWRELMDMDKNI